MSGAGKKKKEAKHLEGIVSGLLQKWQASKVKKGNAVRTAWEAATSAETRAHAQPVNYRHGTLVVIVENSSWLYKLTLERKTILEKFNASYAGRKKAAEIRFRIGALSGE
jgi:predicted nucleic acid-binding Zn ribbon protein